MQDREYVISLNGATDTYTEKEFNSDNIKGWLANNPQAQVYERLPYMADDTDIRNDDRFSISMNGSSDFYTPAEMGGENVKGWLANNPKAAVSKWRKYDYWKDQDVPADKDDATYVVDDNGKKKEITAAEYHANRSAYTPTQNRSVTRTTRDENGNPVVGDADYMAHVDHLRNVQQLQDFMALHGEEIQKYDDEHTKMIQGRLDPNYAASIIKKDKEGRKEEIEALKAERDRLVSQRNQNPYYHKLVQGDLDEANALLEELGVMSKEKIAEEGGLKNAVRFGGGLGSSFSAPAMRTYLQKRRSLTKNDRLAENLATKAKKVLEAPDKDSDKENPFRNFLKGGEDTITDPAFWTDGISNIIENNGVKKSVDAIRKKLGGRELTIDDLDNPERIGDILSPDEVRLIKALGLKMNADFNRALDTSNMYRAGQTATESLKFMLEFIATGGVARSVEEGVGKGFGKWVANSMESMAARGASEGAKLAARGGIRLAEAIAKPAVSSFARMWLMPSTYENMSDAMAYQMDYSTGHLKKGTIKDAIKSIPDSWVEVWSEQALEPMFDIAGKTLGYAGKGNVGRWIKEQPLGNFAILAHNSDYAKFLRQAGFHGYLEEMMEELLGAGTRQVLGIDDNAWEQFWDKEQLGQMAVAFLPMSLAGAFGVRANIKRANRNFEQERPYITDLLVRSGLSVSEATDMLNKKAHTMDEIASNINEVVRKAKDSGKLTEEDRQHLISFAAAQAQKELYESIQKMDFTEENKKVSDDIEQSVGNKYWQGEAPEEGQPDLRQVETIVYADGRRLFVTAKDDNGYACVDEKGNRQFLSAEEYANQQAEGLIVRNETRPINDFLSDERQTRANIADQERQARDAQQYLQAVMDKVEEEKSIPIMENGQQVGTLTVVETTPDGVTIADGEGYTNLSWQEVADMMGMPTQGPSADAVEEAQDATEIRMMDVIADLNKMRGTRFDYQGASYNIADVMEDLPEDDGTPAQTITITTQQGNSITMGNDEAIALLDTLQAQEQALAEADRVAQEQAQTTEETPQEPEQEVSQPESPEVPTDEKGRKLYTQAPAEVSYQDIFSDENFETTDEAYGFVSGKLKRAQEAAKKQKQKADKIKPENYDTPAEYRAAKDKANAELQPYLEEQDYWQSVKDLADADILANRKMQEAAERNRENRMREPQTLNEVVADAFIAVKNGLNKESFMKETGYGAEDMKPFFQLWAKKGQGMTVWEFAQFIADNDSTGLVHTDETGNKDVQAVRNAILEVFQSASKPADLYNYTKESNEAREESLNQQAEQAAAAAAEEVPAGNADLNQPAEEVAQPVAEQQETQEEETPAEEQQPTAESTDNLEEAIGLLNLAAESAQKKDEAWSEWLSSNTDDAQAKRRKYQDEYDSARSKLLPLACSLSDADFEALSAKATNKEAQKLIGEIATRRAEIVRANQVSASIQGKQKTIPTKAKPVSKINLYASIGTNPNQPGLQGVFHDNGYAVASNAHILLADAGQYDKKKEGKLIGKDGKVIDAQFPKWRDLFDKKWRVGARTAKVDFGALRDFLASVKAQREAEWKQKKDAGQKVGSKSAYVNEGKVLLNLGDNAVIGFKFEYLSQLADFAEHIGAKELEYIDNRKAVIVRTKKGIGLLMPIMPDFKDANGVETTVEEMAEWLVGLGYSSFGQNASQRNAQSAAKAAQQAETTAKAEAYLEGKTPEQLAAEKEEARRAPIRARIADWNNRLGINVQILESRDEVKNTQALRAIDEGEAPAAWYSPSTKTVSFYMPNITDDAHVDRLFMHEVVSHRGLRELLGDERFNELMDSVWKDLMTEEDRAKWLDYVSYLGNASEQEKQRAAADEYVAHLAEDLDSAESLTKWEQFVAKVREILQKIGIDLKLTEADLQTLLRASLANYEKRQAKAREEALAAQDKRADTAALVEGEQTKAAMTQAAATNPQVPISQSQEKYEDFGQKIGMARKDTATSGYKKGKADDRPAWMKKYGTSNIQMLSEQEIAMRERLGGGSRNFEEVVHDVSKGTDFEQPFVGFWTEEKKTFYGKRTIKHYITDENRRPIIFTSQAQYEATLPVFEAKEQGFRVHQKGDKWIIYRYASNNKAVEYAEFDTKEDAVAYLASPEGATSLLNRKRENYELPALTKLTRVGMPDWRKGRDVTPDDYLRDFGFRGGEFGNWLNAEERQQFLNYGYDALMDLAHILGISPKALTLNGELSIAFGARGTQGARAHYEPTRAVINLTKMKGAGSLAHEWAHALDNFFGLMDAKVVRDREDDKGGNAQFLSEGTSFRRGTRDELRKAMANVMSAIKRKEVTRAIEVEAVQAQIDDNKKWAGKRLDSEIITLEQGRNKYKYNRKTKQYDQTHIAFTPEQSEQLRQLAAQLDSDPTFKWQYNMAKGGFRAEGEVARKMYALVEDIMPNKKESYGPLNDFFYYYSRAYALFPRLEAAKRGESETVSVDTDMMKDSAWFDRGRAGGYFTKDLEMFARAFETYVYEKMHQSGQSSDYLTYEKGELYRQMWEHSPYPMDEERKTVDAAFDALFDTIQEKTDEETGNPVLFSRAYHGTGADFERFDHSHMGEGEGGQFYGWGTYVTTNRETGLDYARRIGGSDEQYERAVRSIENEQAYIASRIERSESDAEKEALKERNDLLEQRKKEMQRHLYVVNIPEDNGENYLHWNEPITTRQSRLIRNAVRRQLSDEWGEELEYELDSAFCPDCLGSQVEGGLDYFLGDAKDYATRKDPGAERNAKLLNSLGIVGIEIPVDNLGGQRYSGSNYVIFNEDDIKIEENIRFSKAQKAQKLPGKEYVSDAEIDEPILFSLSKNNRRTIEAWFNKRKDLSEGERKAVIDYLDTIDNPTEQLAAAKWFAQGKIRLPEDMPKVEQAVDVAGKAKVDPLRYDNPMALLDAHADFKPSEKRINPDDVQTLHRAKEYPEIGIVVYDVDEGIESRQNMRRIINTHFGKDASPWCLLQGDGEGNLTEQSAQYWKHYNAYPKQVAFHNGKLVAFSANDNEARVWWDRNDEARDGIPITKKIPKDKLGRTATYEVDESGDLGEPKSIHRGNTNPGGTYEEWYNGGEQLKKMTKYGAESRIVEDKEWYRDGQLASHSLVKDNIEDYQRWNEEGVLRAKTRRRVSDGVYIGEQRTWFDDGKPQSIESYDDRGLIHGLFESYSFGWGNVHPLVSRVHYNHGVLDGVREAFYNDGSKRYEYTFENGIEVGPYNEWYDNGQKKTEGQYVAGDKEGEWKYYNVDGSMSARRVYHEGHMMVSERYSNGIIYQHQNYDTNNNLHGDQEIYEDGKLSERQVYDHGTRVKVSVFDKDGNETVVESRGDSDVRFSKKAPNGQPSNLTDRQYEMVRTPQFKEWFGDSVVVDENGEPLVVYHGGYFGNPEGRLEDVQSPYVWDDRSNGWFSTSERYAKNYTHDFDQKPIQVFLNIRNPFAMGDTMRLLVDNYKPTEVAKDYARRLNVSVDEILSLIDKDYSYEDKNGKTYRAEAFCINRNPKFSELLAKNGYDGAMDIEADGSVGYMITRPNQVKSAEEVTTNDLGEEIALADRFNAETDDIRFSKRTKEDPKKVKPVYKLMRLGEDGKLYPLFIDSTEPLEIGQWYDADSPNLDMLREMPDGVFLVDYNDGDYKSLRQYARENGFKAKKFPRKEDVEQAAADGLRWVYIEPTDSKQARYEGENRKYWNLGINGSGSVSTFAMRPGWHAGSLPTMRQIGKGANRDLRDDSFVWVKGSIPADVDYQAEADNNPGKDIPMHIPTDGYYLKATNADSKKSQADRIGWYVAGSFRPDRILGDQEARDIIDRWNAIHYNETPVEYDYPRESGRTFNAQTMQLEGGEDIRFSKQVAAELYDRYENGEDWMSDKELILEIEKQLPYGVDTENIFQLIDKYHRLDNEDFEEGRRDFSGGERDDVFDQILSALGEYGDVDDVEDIRFAKANRNQEIFISNAQKAVEGIQMEKATPEQWLKMLEKNGGLKAGEDKWLGLSDWLKESDKKTLAKQEVLDFIDENKIRIEEKHYGELYEFPEAFLKKYPGYQHAFSLDSDDFRGRGYVDGIYDIKIATRLYNDNHDDKIELQGRWVSDEDYKKLVEYGEELLKEGTSGEIDPTRISYTTEGLDNKREIALTVPTIEPYNESDRIHFGDAGEGRAIAWVRFGDAQQTTLKPEYKEAQDTLGELEKKYGGRLYRNPDITAEDRKRRDDAHEIVINEPYNRGKKTLFIDEIQSKRHQDGREKGYTDENVSSIDEASRKAIMEYNEYAHSLLEKYNLDRELGGMLAFNAIAKKCTEEERVELARLMQKKNAANDEFHRAHEHVPAAPFEKNWMELAFKRMLRLAAEEGYDYVAWTTGEQQAERYNIGKVVDDVEKRDGKIYIDLKDGSAITLTTDRDGVITSSSGAHIESGEYNGKNLSELIGKDLAQEVLSTKGDKVFRGMDLRIGGEGMKGFYDDMLPRFVNKYCKKWGVQVSDMEFPDLDAGITAHTIPVTQEMKDSVMEGQVMFSKAYHGSPADFDVFDNEHIGEGEGFAAHGYGHYVTFDKETGKGYAWNLAFDKAERKHLIEPGIAAIIRNDSFDDYDSMVSRYDELLAKEKQRNARELDEARKDVPQDMAIIRTLETEQEILAGYEPLEEVFNGMRNIYTVEIPDDNGENYLVEDAPVSKDVADKIISYLSALPEINDYINFAQYRKDMSREEIINHVINISGNKGGQVYSNIAHVFGFSDQKASQILHDAGFVGIKYNGRKDGDCAVIFDGKDLTIDEHLRFSKAEDTIKAETETAEDSVEEAKQTLRDEIRSVGKRLSEYRKVAVAQRKYDRETVDAVTHLARRMMEEGLLTELSATDVKRLLSSVRSAVGKAHLDATVNRIIELVADNQIRHQKNALVKMISTRATKINQSGVEEQGTLDVAGQTALKTFKALMGKPIDEIETRIAETENRLTSDDEIDAARAAAELDGLRLAQLYADTIDASIKEEYDLRQALQTARTELRSGKMTEKAYREFVADTEDAIRENRSERIDAYDDLMDSIREMISGSRERAAERVEAEKARVEQIHHFANSDMQGLPDDEHGNKNDRWTNNAIIRWLNGPLATFDQMLRAFGRKSVRGEGYLFNKFLRGWNEARDNEISGIRSAKKELDKKVQEVFGDKHMRWSDLYSKVRSMPTVKVNFWDGGEMKDHDLTQGNLLYIYMVNKMSDGRMKLRRMGITQEDVDAIVEQMDPKFIEIADWLQDTFLKDKRNKYNEVYERMFGAPMAAIENYFPLRINARSRVQEQDVAKEDVDAKPSTITNSIIKRVRNAQALDVLNADAFSVAMEHIEEMEHWAAFAEYTKDLNTLLSYKHFRNQVENMSTLFYGAGSTIWLNFVNSAKIAVGRYQPVGKKSETDRNAVNIAKGVTTAKISFRLYTAIKQLLSFPAYFSDANIFNLAKNLVMPRASWKWSMENLPMFRERWESRMAGDSRLMNTDDDWKLWQKNAVKLASRLGLSPNAFVDAVTVAIGAKSMYETRKKAYLKSGYSEEKAEKKAKQDAEILYNETQQSTEGAFLSAMQLDRTWASTALTVFRNSSMGYQRQMLDAARNLARRFGPGYKEASIGYMTKQMIRDGIPEEDARKAAERLYNKALVRDAVRVAIFGYVLQFAWNLGSYLPYLLFGDDDDKKEQMLKDAARHGMFGPIEGLSAGNALSEIGNIIARDGSIDKVQTSNLTLMPVASDIQRLLNLAKSDKVAAANELVNLGVQAFLGVNPQTFTDMLVAVVDACNGDLEASKEAMMLIMRIMNVPQSQLDQLYLDEVGMTAAEAKEKSAEELARRYAEYRVKRGAPLTGWAYSDEEREKQIDKYEKQFSKKLKERKDLNRTPAEKAYDEWVEDVYNPVTKTLNQLEKDMKDANVKGDYMDFTEKAQRLNEFRQSKVYQDYVDKLGVKKAIDKTSKKLEKLNDPDSRIELEKMLLELKNDFAKELTTNKK